MASFGASAVVGNNFILFFGTSIGIKRRITVIGKSNLLFGKCFKMCNFFRIDIQSLKKVLIWPQNFFGDKNQYGYNRISYWFQIRWCRLLKMLLKSYKQKNNEKMCINKNIQNSHSFGFNFLGASKNWKTAYNFAFSCYQYWYFSGKKIGVILLHFLNFECKCEKTVHFTCKTICKK